MGHDRLFLLYHVSEFGTGETFPEVSHITKGAGSVILARGEHSLWTFPHVGHTGSLFELGHDWTVSAAALWRLLSDKTLARISFPSQMRGWSISGRKGLH